MALLQPVEKVIMGKKFLLSKFPAVEGREILSNYSASGFPNITDYKANETMMFKLMNYVAVVLEGCPPLQLSTKELINNHISDWGMLLKIEHEMIELNSNFLKDGRT